MSLALSVGAAGGLADLAAQSTPDLAGLESAIGSFLEAERIPGAAVAIVRGGLPTLLTFGVADLRTGESVTEHTRFAIGSTTKPFTAAAIMMLVEEGRLTTADTLGRFFPELPSEYDGITIDQLLRHRSGVRRDLTRGHSLEGRALLRALVETPLEFTPGERLAYSNTGFILLGMIVERVTGRPLGSFLRQRVFEPLGMDSTVYLTPTMDRPAMAIGYEMGFGEPLPQPFLPVRHGAGSIVSTAHDLARWARATLDGVLLDRSTHATMWLDGSGAPAGDLTDGLGRPFVIGYGWWKTDDAGRHLIQHGGSLDGYRSTVDLYPDEDLAVVVLTNNDRAPLLPLVRMVSDTMAGRSRSPSSRPLFHRVADFEPIEHRASTGGVSWVDFDGDGDSDLFVANGYDVSSSDPRPQANHLYENLGDGTMRALDPPVLAEAGFSSGSVWADLDDDGVPDALVPNQRGQSNFLYAGAAGGGFRSLRGPPTRDRAASFAASAADVDGDGLVDLFVTNGGLAGAQPDRLYRNLGGGRFEPVPGGPAVDEALQSFGPSWVDYDLDGDPDLFVAGTFPRLYRNDGAFRLTPVDAPFVGDPELSRSYTGAWGDYDNDGDFDLYLSSVLGSHHLFVNEGGEFTRRSSGRPDLGFVTIHATWVDLDNSGYLDLIVASWGAPAAVYMDVARNGFVRTPLGDLGTEVNYSAAMAYADHDADGDLDVLIAHWPNAPGPEEENRLYRNDGPAGNWLRLDLVGTESNRSALGARVEATVRIDGHVQRLTREVRGADGWRSQNEATVHFGLGDASEAEDVVVYWPSGAVQRLGRLAAGQRREVTEIHP